MFTGIISAVGTIQSLTPKAGGIAITVDAHTLDLSDIGLGDSIALNGCCLTVVEQHEHLLVFDVSPETLAHTSGFAAGMRVNMEKAMRLSDRLGGHLVSGHVDGIGTITTLEPVDAPDNSGEHNYLLNIEVPKALRRFIAPKGSLTVNGVSLTTNTIEGGVVGINLIPHTYANTIFSSLKEGDPVNLEVDLIARYIAQLLPER
jgi:riboflavin synthase, alpha subunit